MDNSGYEYKREYYNKMYTNKLNKVKEIEELLNGDGLTERVREIYEKRLSDGLDVLTTLKSQVDYVRPFSQEDYDERLALIDGYNKAINEAIGDTVPIVFHGNKHLGVVESIIRSGGLFTPEERNVSMRSFASQIDVTYKGDIRVSLEFAEPGFSSYLPYGAIFAFFPKEEEVENVLSTGESSEVFGGVEGVNFIEEPDRLVAIITTTENLDVLRSVCEEVGIDQYKVMTHKEFLDLAPDISYGLSK